jgi:hypothetical protein
LFPHHILYGQTGSGFGNHHNRPNLAFTFFNYQLQQSQSFSGFAPASNYSPAFPRVLPALRPASNPYKTHINYNSHTIHEKSKNQLFFVLFFISIPLFLPVNPRQYPHPGYH